MSWFKHRPLPKEKRKTTPHQTGPITRDLWNQTKNKKDQKKKLIHFSLTAVEYFLVY